VGVLEAGPGAADRLEDNGPIVRLVQLTVDEQLGGVRELLERHAALITGPVIVTITRERIRIRH